MECEMDPLSTTQQHTRAKLSSPSARSVPHFPSCRPPCSLCVLRPVLALILRASHCSVPIMPVPDFAVPQHVSREATVGLNSHTLALKPCSASQRESCATKPILKRCNSLASRPSSTSSAASAPPPAVHFRAGSLKFDKNQQKQQQQKQRQKQKKQKQRKRQQLHDEEQHATPAVLCRSSLSLAAAAPASASSTTSIQCRSFNINGNRCKRFTCHGYTCFYHLRKEMGLVVKQSSIPRASLGLFTVWPRVKGDRIVAYEGEHIRSEAVYSGPYVLQLSKHSYIDANDPFCGVGRYANCCRTGDKGEGSCRANNTHLAIDSASKTASIIATRSMEAGEEVLCAYGQSYW
jgi:hypothetical protein